MYNLSSYILMEAAHALLKKGLSFAPYTTANKFCLFKDPNHHSETSLNKK